MRKFFALLFILLLTYQLNAQEKKVNYGGMFSVDFGQLNDRVEVTPYVFTKILQKTYIGVGATFAYYQQKNDSFYVDLNNNIVEFETKNKTTYFGGNIFLRYFLFEQKNNSLKNLFIHSEIEILKGNGKYSDFSGSYKYNTTNTTPFLGLGYKQPLSSSFSLNANLLFKLNNEDDSPYRNPIIKLGFEF